MTFIRRTCVVLLCVVGSVLSASAGQSLPPPDAREVADALAMLKAGRPLGLPPREWEAFRLLFIASLGEKDAPVGPALPFVRSLLTDPSVEVAVAAATLLLKVDRAASEAAAMATIGAVLASPNEAARQVALTALEKTTPLPRAAQVLAIDYLRQSGRNRWQPANALQNVPPDGIAAAVPPLTALLAGPDWELAGAAAATLGSFGMQARTAIGPLEQLLSNSDRQTRLAAALALQKIDDPGKPALLKVFVDTILTNDESTRGQQFRRRDHDDALRGLEAIGPTLSEIAVPALIVLLTGGEDGVKVRTADLLGKMGPAARQAVPHLRTLAAADQWASGPAKDALREIEGVPAADKKPPFDPAVALRDLRSPDVETRRKTLWEISYNRAEARGFVDALVAALRDPDLAVRYLAAYVLTGIDPKAAVPALPILQEMLRSNVNMGGSSPRILGPGGLGRMGRAGADVLVRALSDSDPATRIAAAQGLMDSDEFPAAAVPALLTAARGSDALARHQALMALLMRKPPAAQMIRPLVAALADPDVDMRTGAAQGLGGYGREAASALDALKKATRDVDGRVQVSAASAITAIDRKAGLELLPLFIAELSRSEEERRFDESHDCRLSQAAFAVATLGADARAALPALMRAWERHRGWATDELGVALALVDPASAGAVLKSFIRDLDTGHPDARLGLLRQMPRLGALAAPAIPSITRLTSDPDPLISEAAAKALAAIR